MSKIKLPSEVWVKLYTEISEYVENKCYPNRKTHNEEGERIEETQDDFCEIVDDVESILETFFKKEDEEKPKYNSVIEFICSIDHDKEDGSDITGAMMRKALLKRINLIDDQKCGSLYYKPKKFLLRTQ
jgi:hypothetical protein